MPRAAIATAGFALGLAAFAVAAAGGLDTPRALRSRTVDPIFRVRTEDAPRAVQTLVDTSGVVEAAMYGRNVHVTVEDEMTGPETIRAALATAGVGQSAIEPVEPSLEDVFTSLVRAEGGAVIG